HQEFISVHEEREGQNQVLDRDGTSRCTCRLNDVVGVIALEKEVVKFLAENNPVTPVHWIRNGRERPLIAVGERKERSPTEFAAAGHLHPSRSMASSERAICSAATATRCTSSPALAWATRIDTPTTTPAAAARSRVPTSAAGRREFKTVPVRRERRPHVDRRP